MEEAKKINAKVQYELQYERDNFRPVESTSEVPETHTLESLFYLYLRDRNFSKNNLYTALKGAKMIMEEYGQIEIENVDYQLLNEIQKMCLASGNKGATVKRKMAIIKAMLNWGYRNSFLEKLPRFPVSPISDPKRYVPPSKEEINKIYNVSPRHLERVIILGFMFGMRVGQSEMLKLQWADVDIANSVIRVPNAKKGYGEPWRDVPIREDILPLIIKWHDEDKKTGIAFVVHYNGKPVQKIRNSWKSALSRAGITRHIRPYDLRHGFATEAIAAGANYGVVAELMGHKSPMMILRHYQHVNNLQKKATVENLPKLNFSKELV